MNGIHDMGGMHGFGKVEVEPDEPVFHARWEGRVLGMVLSTGGNNIDAGRHSIERVGPVAYLKNGYYGRWLAALENTLLEFGVVTMEEIQARMKSPRPPERPAAPVAPSRRRPASRPYTREVATKPGFTVGQAVETRNHQPEGHTRLPGYARCRSGTVVRVHPAMVYPDDHAHGRGENPQYLYTVMFAARELWGDGADPGVCVSIDLFESYLQPAAGQPGARHAPRAKRPSSKKKRAAGAPRR